MFRFIGGVFKLAVVVVCVPILFGYTGHLSGVPKNGFIDNVATAAGKFWGTYEEPKIEPGLNAAPKKPEPVSSKKKATFVRVKTYNTIVVKLDMVDTVVRLSDVRISDPGKRKAAKAALKARLKPGKVVCLKFSNPRQDEKGRTLAVVTVKGKDGKKVNLNRFMKGAGSYGTFSA